MLTYGSSCKNLDLCPVNIRFLQANRTKKSFLIAPPHGISASINVLKETLIHWGKPRFSCWKASFPPNPFPWKGVFGIYLYWFIQVRASPWSRFLRHYIPRWFIQRFPKIRMTKCPSLKDFAIAPMTMLIPRNFCSLFMRWPWRSGVFCFSRAKKYAIITPYFVIG